MIFKKQIPRSEEEMELILSEIKKIWMENPYLRLGQLISNKVSTKMNDLFYVEDEDFMKLIKE